MAAGQDRAKNLHEPYCVIIIPLSWEQDGTGEVEECCFAATLAKTWDKEAPPSLGFGHRSFGVTQGERLAARLAREWEGQPGRVESGDVEEMPASCLACAQRLPLCWGDTGRQPSCRLLVLWGRTACQLVRWEEEESRTEGDGETEEMGAKVLSGPHGGMVEGKLAGARH